MAVIALTGENFDKVITSHDLVLVDFWALWCGPCRVFGEVFETLSERYPDVLFAKVDVEKEPQLAKDFEVHSIPLLMVFRGNVAVYKEPGALTAAALEEVIAKAKTLDLHEIQSMIKDTNA